MNSVGIACCSFSTEERLAAPFHVQSRLVLRPVRTHLVVRLTQDAFRYIGRLLLLLLLLLPSSPSDMLPACLMIRVGLVIAGAALTRSTPLTVITSNNPHAPHPLTGVVGAKQPQADASNLPPIIQWADLYEKEVGTWCAPESSTERMRRPVAPVTGPPPHHEDMVPPPLEDDLALDPPPSGDQRNTHNDTAMLTRWVDAALRVVRSHLNSCEDDSCQDSMANKSSLPSRPVPSEMNLYVARASNAGQMMAVLPDGPLAKTGARDAWILLDPSPHAPFGHTIYLFAVDFKMSDSVCLANGGTPVGKFHSLIHSTLNEFGDE